MRSRSATAISIPRACEDGGRGRRRDHRQRRRSRRDLAHHEDPPAEFGPATLKAAAEDSLRKLETDYLDLPLLHWPNPNVPLERTLDAMADLKDAGAIRHAGVSNFPARNAHGRG